MVARVLETGGGARGLRIRVPRRCRPDPYLWRVRRDRREDRGHAAPTVRAGLRSRPAIRRDRRPGPIALAGRDPALERPIVSMFAWRSPSLSTSTRSATFTSPIF